MTTQEQMKIALTRVNMSQSDLAKKLGTTKQNLNKKILRDRLSPAKLNVLAEAMGCRYIGDFVFEEDDK